MHKHIKKTPRITCNANYITHEPPSPTVDTYLAWSTNSAYRGSGILRTIKTVKAIISLASRGGNERRILFGLSN